MSEEEGDLYEINGVNVIQHGGSLYMIEGGSIYPTMTGNGFWRKAWKKLAPIGRALNPIVRDLKNTAVKEGKDYVKKASDYVVKNEDRVVRAAENEFEHLKENVAKEKARRAEIKGQGIRDALTPAQRKAYDKVLRESKN